jgi:hypothetical protein
MQINVLEVGLSEKDKKNIGYRKNVFYYVFHRGQLDEAAYYAIDQPINTSLKDVSISASSYQAISNLIDSDVLRSRTRAAIITQCSVVFQEAPGTTNHANRMKLVSAANLDLNNVVSRFMSAIALNATVQAQGTAVTDVTLQSIVSGAWDSYASLIVA